MIAFHDLVVETVPLSALRQHPDNPNNGDADIVAESMAVNGVYAPIYAQRSTGRILAGHTRYEALLAHGALAGPVIWLDVDDEQALRILAVDNGSASRAHMDPVALGEILEALNTTTTGLAGTSYDHYALERLRDLNNDQTTLLDILEPSDADEVRQNKREITCPNCGHHFGGGH